MESVRLVLYFNSVFNLYELMIVKYLTFHLSPHENILTLALINIHYYLLRVRSPF